MTASAGQPDAASRAVVRKARPDDAGAIADLLAVLGYPSAAAQIEERIAGSAASPDGAVFVAEAAGHVAGLLSFHCIPMFHAEGPLGRITSLVVAPAFRQRGIGRLLVASAEEYAAAHGCDKIEVTSGDHRPEAHSLYERLGYRCDCRRFIKSSRDT
jgi:GNAT superfamily N-acetyltransferase